ncbi:MAG TPA: 2-dehydropantoate 2-reductase, partial [Terriglobales bacterium]|nr:2-dehydropantoate 2-reductase [Terriglobales bacterium]
AKLARAGEDVTFVARGAHRAAIEAQGLRVRSVSDGEWVVKCAALEDPAGLPPADVVFLTVKANDTEAVLQRARPIVGPDTAVVSLQNGVQSAEIIDRVLGRGHAVGGACYVFAVIEAPGVIGHRLLGRIAFGELDGRRTPRAERLLATLGNAGIPTELAPDIRRVLWEKYLMICAQAGMTALTRVPSGVLRAHPPTWAMYRAIVAEVAAVGRAEGVALAADAVDTVMKNAEALAPGAFSSLHHDLVNGKPLELEALHGHLVRLGQRHGVPTPMTQAVYAALLPHAAGAPA